MLMCWSLVQFSNIWNINLSIVDSDWSSLCRVTVQRQFGIENAESGQKRSKGGRQQIRRNKITFVFAVWNVLKRSAHWAWQFSKKKIIHGLTKEMHCWSNTNMQRTMCLWFCSQDGDYITPVIQVSKYAIWCKTSQNTKDRLKLKV